MKLSDIDDDYLEEVIEDDNITKTSIASLGKQSIDKKTIIKSQLLDTVSSMSLIDLDQRRKNFNNPNMSSGGKMGRKKKAGKTFGKNKKKK